MNREYTDHCRFLIELRRSRNTMPNAVPRNVDILCVRIEVCKIYILKIASKTMW